MKARLLVITLCAAVLGMPWGLPGQADQTPRHIAWQPCSDNPALDCGTLQVPIDWSNLDGPTLTLDVTRQKAAVPAERLGVLVLAGSNPLTPAQDLLDHFDIIRFIAIAPKYCTLSVPAVPAFPASQQQLDQVRNGLRGWYLACAQQVGPSFTNDNSAASARDIDAIRAALGERQISLMHTWENEIVGQLYAELFPGRVRAMVLDGNLDHSVTSAADYLAWKAQAVEATFDGFADWCRRTPDCALYGQDIRGIYDQLRARSEAGQLDSISPAELSIHVGSAGDYPDLDWYRLARYYRAVYERVFPGTLPPETPAQLSAGLTTTPESTPAGQPTATTTAGMPTPPTTTTLRRGISYGSFCQDWNLPINSYADLVADEAAEARLAPNVLVNNNQWLNVLSCLGWPFAVGDPQHRLSIGRPLPVLVVNGSYAPGQPTAWADSVAAQIPGSAHLVYQGPGTLAYRQSPCVRAAVDTFLITLRKPAAATCPAIWPSQP